MTVARCLFIHYRATKFVELSFQHLVQGYFDCLYEMQISFAWKYFYILYLLIYLTSPQIFSLGLCLGHCFSRASLSNIVTLATWGYFNLNLNWWLLNTIKFLCLVTLALFQILKRYMCLVATILGRTNIECFCYHRKFCWSAHVLSGLNQAVNIHQIHWLLLASRYATVSCFEPY